MRVTSELQAGGSSPLSGMHRSQALVYCKSVRLHGSAKPRIVEYCSRRSPTTRQRGCEGLTADHHEKLRQQAAAIAASLLLSAGYTCAPAEAYNVRLQDVESKAMQAGMQATDPV